MGLRGGEEKEWVGMIVVVLGWTEDEDEVGRRLSIVGANLVQLAMPRITNCHSAGALQEIILGQWRGSVWVGLHVQ